MPVPTPAETAARRAVRARRRGLYGPPPRLTLTSPLVGRLLWAIGDWGRASEHIGQRWESVAADLVRARTAGDALVVLHANPALMAEVLTTNLPHADALRTFAREGALVLEPFDFKWSLETASVRQVAGETLTALLAQETPHLAAALDAARATLHLPPSAPVVALDGHFVAPEHPANRAALRADPGLPALVLSVDPATFFRPLPGWPTALVLAKSEGVALDSLRGIENVERYYRLGAGVLGALTRLRTGLFDEAPEPVDGPTEVQTLLQTVPGASLHALLLHLEGELTRRRGQEELLVSVPRAAYPFSRLRADLAEWGVPPAIVESRGPMGRLHGMALAEAARAVRVAGRQLVAAGATADEALARLASESGRWSAIARRRARELAPTLVSPGAPRGGDSRG